MSVLAVVDGRVVEFASQAELWALVERRARERHPERYAPDGEPLTWERGETWAERRTSWQWRHRPKVDPEPVEDTDGPGAFEGPKGAS